MGSAGLYFINQVSLLLVLSKRCIVNVHGDTLGVIDDKIIFLKVSKEAFVAQIMPFPIMS